MFSGEVGYNTILDLIYFSNIKCSIESLMNSILGDLNLHKPQKFFLLYYNLPIGKIVLSGTTAFLLLLGKLYLKFFKSHRNLNIRQAWSSAFSKK